MNPVTRFAAAVAAGFAIMFIINAFAAAVIIDPLFGSDYPEVASDDAALDWPLLLGGYALIAVAVGCLHRRRLHDKGWVERGLSIGIPVGLATFGGVHLIQAGYTTIDNTAWILAGLLDVFGPIAASVVMARVLSRQQTALSPATRVDQQLAGLDDPNQVDANIAQLETVAATIDQHLSRLRQSSNAR